MFEEIPDGDTVWRFDREFLTSNWTCIWDRGCHGIRREPEAALGLGCCSLGAELDGEDEVRMIAASAAALRPELFQHHRDARTGGVFADTDRTSTPRANTRVVDGACIFLNRPGFEGGAGCALHIAAAAADESPLDWKPSVCWQLPVKVDWEMGDDEVEIATVRAWSRADWGTDGVTMAWCCTERAADGGTDEAYIGDGPAFETLADELEAIVGTPVYLELGRRLRSGDHSTRP